MIAVEELLESPITIDVGMLETEVRVDEVLGASMRIGKKRG